MLSVRLGSLNIITHYCRVPDGLHCYILHNDFPDPLIHEVSFMSEGA